jgi:GT2 family glycosyltransferase/SAM-dependent methyltransferase/glycosyltransferase involved in cell wall biosynthesis
MDPKERRDVAGEAGRGERISQVLADLQIGDELFWEPVRIVPPEPWVGHIPFAFWLVKALRPEMFVELGTHSGNSFSAFCQAIASLAIPGRAFAVDTWKGDEHAGRYGEEVFADLVAFNNAHYVGFATLLRTTFDDARRYFADGSIDLLHIDGLHSYEAVQHDFEHWRSALSRRAVVVFHDINVREHDFGVWKLWHELSHRYPSFQFDHSYGLGVLGVGEHQTALLQRLFELGTNQQVALEVRRWFSSRGVSFQRLGQLSSREVQILTLSNEVACKQGELQGISQALGWVENMLRTKQAVIDTKDELLRSVNEALISRDNAILIRDQIIDRKDHAIAEKDRELAEQRNLLREREAVLELSELRTRELERELEQHVKRLWEQAAAAWEQVQLTQDQLSKLQNSASLRVMTPLRTAGILSRRVLAKVRQVQTQPQVAAVSNSDGSGPTREIAGRTDASEASAVHQAELSAPNIDHKAALSRQLAARLDAFLVANARLRLPRSDQPDLSIIVVLHNRAELTFGCLTSIIDSLGEAGVGIEVLIFDSGSTDSTADLLDRVDGARIFRSPQNLHFLRSVNRTAREALGRNILLLNNDAQLIPGSIETAIATLESDEQIGAVGGRLILLDGNLQEAGSIIWKDGTCLGYGRGRNPSDPEFMFRREVDYCSAAFLLTRRNLFERLGGFDERYAPAYYEDADYCLRLWQAGFSVVFEPNVAVLHYEFGSSSGEEEALSLQQRNWKLFAERHAEWLAGRFAPSDENVLSARTARSAKRILMIEDRVPKVVLGSGYPRSRDLVEALVSAGAQVTLYPMFEYVERWSEVRRSIDSQVEVVIQGSSSQLRAFLQSRRGYYDAFLICRPHNMKQFLAAVESDHDLLGDAKVIYDAEAVFTRRDLLHHQLAGEMLPPDEARRAIAEEIVLSRMAHCVISVSPAEQRLFRNHGVNPVYLLGHKLQPNPTRNSFEERSEIIFLGAIHHENSPNADGLRWFATEILPLLREELGHNIRLRVVGLNQAASIAALDGSSLELAGPVQDLTPWFEAARVMIVPTRFAAGMPHKVHQAAALGVPVVATNLIVEQTGWTPDREILAASGPDQFAKACARLFSDKGLWESIRQNALERCREECSPGFFLGTIHRILATIPARGQVEREIMGPPPQPQDEDPPYVGRAIEEDYSLAVPLSYVPTSLPEHPALAVICHLYHIETMDEIHKYLINIPFPLDLFISTNTPEKHDLVARRFTDWDKGDVEIRIMPNRGRDIAAKLVGFRDVHERYEYVLHAHSKASSHDKMLAPWRGFLLENLLGSREIVYSVFEIFSRQPRIGIIFPQHYEYIRHWLDWGSNYYSAQTLAERFGIALSPQQTLDFPSGSMFWARTAALEPLLDLGLSLGDFPPESGQTDGTLAHAIERLYLFVCERAGFSWLKLANPAYYMDTRTIVEITSPSALDRYVTERTVRLSGPNPPARRGNAPPVTEELPPGLAKVLQLRTADVTSADLKVGFTGDSMRGLSTLFRQSAAAPTQRETSEEFDESWYRSFYPDVGVAVARGEFASGLDHYIKHGRTEGRLPSRTYRRDVWSVVPEQRAAECGWYWMAHPLVQRRINALISGDPDCDAYAHLAGVLAGRQWPLPIVQAISLGCGFGALERCLVSRGMVENITAYDLSDAAIAEARTLAQDQQLHGLNYEVADLERLTLPANSVDAVFAHQSIHHVEGLERLFWEIRKALKPGGIFHLHEFVGPSRFQWSEAQLALVNDYLSSLPPRLRRLPSGETKALVQRPTVGAMIAADPAEAARSSEIPTLLPNYFTIIERRQIGGALLHLVLGDIAQNFGANDAEDCRHLERLFAIEDRKMAEGVVVSDFVVITAGRE